MINIEHKFNPDDKVKWGCHTGFIREVVVRLDDNNKISVRYVVMTAAGYTEMAESDISLVTKQKG